MERRQCTCGGVYVSAWIACLVRREEEGNRYLAVSGYHCERCGHTLVDEATSEYIAKVAQNPDSAPETFVIPRRAFTKAPDRTELLAGVG